MTDDTTTHDAMLTRFETGRGFLAALDQSGGSSPKALQLYGIEPSEYSGDEQMFDLIHAERVRIMTDPAVTSERILAAILFEDTLGREIDGEGVAEWLWSRKGIVPFLKIDKGLRDEADGVQLMRDIPDLDDLLGRAKEAGALGTKERSVIHSADEGGIAQIVAQQFELAEKVLEAGLLPILEPEVDIHAPDKAAAEALLKANILEHLAGLGDRKVAVKISIPSVDDFYGDLIAHRTSPGSSPSRAATAVRRRMRDSRATTASSRASAAPCSTDSPCTRPTRSSTPPSTRRSPRSTRRR